MPSLRSLLLYVAMGTTIFHTSTAAPAAMCGISYSATAITPSLSLAVPSNPTILPPAATNLPTDGIADVPTSGSTSPSLPTNGGSTELPAPTAALKFVTVGRGVQNYSCNGTGTTPVALGALATLFNVTSLAGVSASDVDAIPPNIVGLPRSSGSSSSISVSGTDFPIIGHHFFDSTGTPVFDLDTVGDILFCKKISSIAAPKNANVGPGGTGAVPWLALIDKGGSVGLSQVYRVVTAGGNPQVTCPDKKVISVQYAAEYWFFG